MEIEQPADTFQQAQFIFGLQVWIGHAKRSNSGPQVSKKIKRKKFAHKYLEIQSAICPDMQSGMGLGNQEKL